LKGNAVGRCLATLGLLVALAGTSVAWACVPQPMVLVQPQASAKPGSQVTVRGLNFARQAEIRFNGIEGPRLATASGEQFFVKLRVPKAPSGLYTLVALTRDQSGGVSSTASTPLQIGAASNQGPAPPAPTAAGGGSSESSSTGVSVGLAAVVGLLLVVLGGAAGALIAARRRRPRPG